MKHRNKLVTRRQFLAGAAGAGAATLAFPDIIPSSVLGADGAVAPSNKLIVGCIGNGPQGIGDMGRFLANQNARVVAVCDVKTEQRDQARGIVNQHYKNHDCKAYLDFREMLARRDIDVCLIATPDHWHVPVGIAAVRAGKDVYIEKPMGCTVGEAQAMRKAVQETRRIFQFGTQQRSDRKFRLACELARGGMLGKLKTVHVWAPGSAPGGSTKTATPPTTLDYERWLGPAPFKPYAENRCDADGNTKTWWFDTDYALGFIAGWGIHPMDIAIWGAGALMKGKVELEGTGNYPTEGACNTATSWDVRLKFNSGLNVIFAGSPNGGNSGKATADKWPHEQEWRSRFGQISTHGTVFEGTDGWARVHRGDLATSPAELATSDPKNFRVKLPVSGDHAANFLEAAATRKPAICPIDEAVWGDTLCQISDIAARLRRKLTFDFATEKFINDAEANNRLAMRPMRPPWNLI
jgi:predicted dehydrogenase